MLLRHNLLRKEPAAAPCQGAARPERSPAVGGVDVTPTGSFRNADRCRRAAARASGRTEGIADGLPRPVRLHCKLLRSRGGLPDAEAAQLQQARGRHIPTTLIVPGRAGAARRGLLGWTAAAAVQRRVVETQVNVLHRCHTTRRASRESRARRGNTRRAASRPDLTYPQAARMRAPCRPWRLSGAPSSARPRLPLRASARPAAPRAASAGRKHRLCLAVRAPAHAPAPTEIITSTSRDSTAARRQRAPPGGARRQAIREPPSSALIGRIDLDLSWIYFEDLRAGWSRV